MENNEPSIEVPCWNCGVGNRLRRQEGVNLYPCESCAVAIESPFPASPPPLPVPEVAPKRAGMAWWRWVAWTVWVAAVAWALSLLVRTPEAEVEAEGLKPQEVRVGQPPLKGPFLNFGAFYVLEDPPTKIDVRQGKTWESRTVLKGAVMTSKMPDAMKRRMGIYDYLVAICWIASGFYLVAAAVWGFLLMNPSNRTPGWLGQFVWLGVFFLALHLIGEMEEKPTTTLLVDNATGDTWQVSIDGLPALEVDPKSHVEVTVTAGTRTMRAVNARGEVAFDGRLELTGKRASHLYNLGSANEYEVNKVDYELWYLKAMRGY